MHMSCELILFAADIYFLYSIKYPICKFTECCISCTIQMHDLYITQN